MKASACGRHRLSHVLAVSPKEQQYAGSGADTSDTDRLARRVEELEVLYQVPAVGLQGPPGRPDQAAQGRLDLPALRTVSNRSSTGTISQGWEMIPTLTVLLPTL